MYRVSFVILMISCPVLLGQEVPIPPNCRVGNPDNRCFGAALEDCARALGMRSLYRVSGQFRGGTCCMWTIRNGQKVVTYSKISDVLRRRGWRQPSNYEEVFNCKDASWLDRRIQAGYPCVVSLGSDHGVCLRKLTPYEAIIVDNDKMITPRGAYWANSDRRMSRQQFLRQWKVLGWAVCLYREPDQDRYYVPGPPRRVPTDPYYYPRYYR